MIIFGEDGGSRDWRFCLFPGSWSFNSHMLTSPLSQRLRERYSDLQHLLWVTSSSLILWSTNPSHLSLPKPLGLCGIFPSWTIAWKQPPGTMLEQLKGSPHLIASFHESVLHGYYPVSKNYPFIYFPTFLVVYGRTAVLKCKYNIRILFLEILIH